MLPFARFLITGTDLLETYNYCSRVMGIEGNQQPTKLQTIQAANSVMMSGSNLVTIALYYLGASQSTLKCTKDFEFYARLMNLPVKVMVEVEHENRIQDSRRFLAVMRIFHQGVLIPMAGLMRVKAEAELYGLDCIMTDNDNPALSQAAERCMSARKEKQTSFDNWTDIGLMIEGLGRRPPAHFDYSRLAQIVAQQPVNTANSVDEELNLLNLAFIPAPLHQDLVFKEYICPITRCPIRHVVGDPNGATLYERNAILLALRHTPRSPITRAPLNPSQLVNRADIQDRIDARLRQHQGELERYLATLANQPVNQ